MCDPLPHGIKFAAVTIWRKPRGVPLIDQFFAVGWMRKAIWRAWYPFLTRRLRRDGVLFLNYAFESDPPLGIPLAPEDEPHRACIQLYHHVAAQVDLSGTSVLEVSCGHGGGASYITRTFQPRQYTALDLNPVAIEFCRAHHQQPKLTFEQGDAEQLPYAAATFDAVINVEASHCYPDFPRFLTEVARVLRPGGHFLYADFRFADRLAEWEQALVRSPLLLQAQREINAEVLRGLTKNSPRSLELIARHLPKFLHGLGRDFAGTRGSRIYCALEEGQLSYRSYWYRKSSPTGK